MEGGKHNDSEIGVLCSIISSMEGDLVVDTFVGAVPSSAAKNERVLRMQKRDKGNSTRLL